MCIFFLVDFWYPGESFTLECKYFNSCVTEHAIKDGFIKDGFLSNEARLFYDQEWVKHQDSLISGLESQ
jgi:hypothetical protein